MLKTFKTLLVAALVSLGVSSSVIADDYRPSVGTKSNTSAILPPDTEEGYFYVTDTPGNPSVTLAQQNGQGLPPFVAPTDNLKLITCDALGTTGVDQAKYVGVIASVVDATHVVLFPPPLYGHSVASIRCTYGTDQFSKIQAALTLAEATGLKPILPSGHYLVSQPLNYQPPFYANNAGSPAAFPGGGRSAIITVVWQPQAGVTTSLLTLGSTNSNYLGYLQGGDAGDLPTLDCNFVASYCLDLPNGRDTKVTVEFKNPVLAGIRVGNQAANTTFDGAHIIGSSGVRDSNLLTVASITYGTTTTVTTVGDHGFTAGRSFVFVNAGNGPAALFAQPFQIASVPTSNTFTIANFNSSGLGPLTGAIAVTENMPGTPFPVSLTSLATGSSTIATTTYPTGWPSGSKVCIYNVNGTSMIDGAYVAGTISGNTIPLGSNPTGTFQPATNTVINGTWVPAVTTGGTNVTYAYMILCPVVDSIANPQPVGILYEEAGDGYEDGNYGVAGIIGVYTGNLVDGPGWGGYDMSITNDHWYTRPTNGLMYTGYVLGGHAVLTRSHTDCPTLFAVQAYGPDNDLFGQEMDCAGFTTLANNQTDFVRIEPGASITVHGGAIVASSPQNVLATVSSAGNSFGSTMGPGSLYGNVPGYAQVGFAGMGDIGVTFAQPDQTYGNMYFNSNVTAATVRLINTYIIGYNLGVCNSSNYGTHAMVSNGATNPTYLQAVGSTYVSSGYTRAVFCDGSNWVYG